ncbi:hypothetical protein RY831_26855 [Noviherbaspirillum sp. CPCC 100848]|uniref:Uncharacterized protein n=1 Tax=Noviherbaspirillum album TaxID=3080276 RepID=A0ABU6JHL5_9BURK|nr:hypothetical protein [Noviherbaspirillum sp. CPCC 100848]MEC4722785.1 hypothetical protein [Noviherbaspirillum sp. CPCC 100848]
MDKRSYQIRAEKIQKRLKKAQRDMKNGVPGAKERVSLHEQNAVQHKLTHG